MANRRSRLPIGFRHDPRSALCAAVTYPPGRDRPTAVGADATALARMPGRPLDANSSRLDETLRPGLSPKQLIDKPRLYGRIRAWMATGRRVTMSRRAPASRLSIVGDKAGRRRAAARIVTSGLSC